MNDSSSHNRDAANAVASSMASVFAMFLLLPFVILIFGIGITLIVWVWKKVPDEPVREQKIEEVRR